MTRVEDSANEESGEACIDPSDFVMFTTDLINRYKQLVRPVIHMLCHTFYATVSVAEQCSAS